MIALALAAVLASSPPQVAIVKRSSSGVANTTTASVMHAVGEVLERQGLAVSIEVLTCGGDPSCLAEAARSSSSVATIAVTVVGGRRQLTLDLEAVDDAERPLGVATFKVPLSGGPIPDEGLAFLQKVAAAVLAAQRPADAPRAVVLEPAPAPAPVAAVVTAPPPRSGSLGLKLSGGAAIGLGAVTLGVVIAALVMKGGVEAQLNNDPAAHGLTRDAAESQVNLTNGLFTASAVGGGLTTAALATAAGLWLAGD